MMTRSELVAELKLVDPMPAAGYGVDDELLRLVFLATFPAAIDQFSVVRMRVNMKMILDKRTIEACIFYGLLIENEDTD